MPIPSPSKGETQDQFIGRCMSVLADSDPDRPQEQRLAMCFTQWRQGREENMHPHFQRILSIFAQKYGEEEGKKRFEVFVTSHSLNVELPYNPKSQFKEAFTWAKAGLYKLREDKEARYYAVNAIHAIISMNDNDYTDWKTMTSAGESMNYRPVNINHDHGRWVPYPRTRLDYAKAEDYQVEGILRVANEDAWLQKAIEHDPSTPKKKWISHPSIEGRENLDGRGYHFTGIAMLEMGYSLPGDPLSDVKPMMLEAAGEQICLLIDDAHVCLPCVETVNNKDSLIQVNNSIVNGNLEPSAKEGNNLNEFQTGPLQRGGAICPSCGHVVPETVTDVTQIKCPVCHTPMQKWDQKTYEMSVIPPEAAAQMLDSLQAIPADAVWVKEADAFNPSADWPDSCFAYVPASAKGADGNKSDRKFPYKYPDGRVSIPNVGNALARLANADIPDADKGRIRELMQNIMKRDNPDYKPTEKLIDTLKELFRPPFPFDPNTMFTKTTTLVIANIPTVGTVKGDRIGLVEYTRLKADYEEYRLSKENEVANLKAHAQRDRQEYSALQEKLAEKERSLAENSAVDATLKEKLQQLGKANASIAELQGTVTALKKQTDGYRETVKAKEKETDEVREELAKTRARLDDTITQLHEASERSSTSTQKAINETQERSRIQEENATLREKVAKLTREISNLTEKASEDAGRLIKLEEELAEVKRRVVGEKAVLDNQLREKQSEVEKARKYLKWANKALVDAGFVKLQVEAPQTD